MPTQRTRGRPRLRVIVATAVSCAVVLLGGVAPTPAEVVVDVEMHELAVPSGPGTRDAAGMAASPVMSTTPFALVAARMAQEATIEVRWAKGQHPWSPWTPLAHQHGEGPDPGSTEAVAAQRRTSRQERTHPLFTGHADRLQVRTDGALEDLHVAFIDPFGLDRSLRERAWDQLLAAWHGRAAAPAHATADTPPIVTREQWGADETIVGQDPAYARRVDRAFVHHTVGSNSYSQEQAAGVVRAVQAYHVNGNGWNDIGYNFLVDRFGTIYEGRAGGIDQAVIGAQAGGFNTSSTGIALMGTFTSAAPSSEALAAVEAIIAWKADIHHFHPLRTAEVTSAGSSRYPAGTVVTVPNVTGHRDVSATACPGDGTYARLDSIRAGVRARAGELIVDNRSDVQETRVVRGDPDVDAITLTAELDPPGEWSIEVYDPDRRVIHTAEGNSDTATTTMELDGSDWALGDYQWAIASPGRTTAFEFVALQPPVITDPSAPTSATMGEGELVSTGMPFSATLWRDASWELRITDANGQEVFSDSGRGQTLDSTWQGTVTGPGTYAWTITAEDARPVGGTVEVRADLLARIADTDDPVAATVALSQAAFDDEQASRAVVARADVFADALAGGPLAGTDGPLLLTPSDLLDDRVRAELDRVLAPDATIHVLGGPAAIAEEVVTQLRGLGAVQRLAGPSRVATAAAIAQAVWAREGTDTALLARAGPDDAAPWADALSGGAYGAASGVPVLLTDTATLSGETAQALVDAEVESTIVLGGPAAVSEAVVDALPSPRRIAGPDRTATAVAVAQQLWTVDQAGREVLLANGYGEQAWAYALAAAPLAARDAAPLLLTTPDTLASPTASHLQQHGVTDGRILGPATLIDPIVGYTASDLVRANR